MLGARNGGAGAPECARCMVGRSGELAVDPTLRDARGEGFGPSTKLRGFWRPMKKPTPSVTKWLGDISRGSRSVSSSGRRIQAIDLTAKRCRDRFRRSSTSTIGPFISYDISQALTDGSDSSALHI